MSIQFAYCKEDSYSWECVSLCWSIVLLKTKYKRIRMYLILSDGFCKGTMKKTRNNLHWKKISHRFRDVLYLIKLSSSKWWIIQDAIEGSRRKKQLQSSFSWNWNFGVKLLLRRKPLTLSMVGSDLFPLDLQLWFLKGCILILILWSTSVHSYFFLWKHTK